MEIFEEIDSTNRYALEGDFPHGYAVLARRQSAGRGQYGRKWESEVGGLYLSVVLRNPSLEGLTIRIGEGIRDFLKEMSGKIFEIKLPNDILFEGEKLGGVLIETKVRGGEVYAVVGVGMDVHNRWGDGKNLAEICGAEIDIEGLAGEIRRIILQAGEEE